MSGISFGALFGNDGAVQRDATGRDELFGFAARRDTGGCDDFLEAFGGHRGDFSAGGADGHGMPCRYERNLFLAGRLRRAGFRFGGVAESCDFAGFERAVAATGDALHRQRSQGDANPLFDGVASFVHHVAQGFFFRVAHADFVPIVSGMAACGIGLAKGLHADASFLSEVREFVARQHAFHLDVVALLDMFPIFEESGGEVAVIGQEDKPARGVFEIADGIDSRGKAAERVFKRLAAFWVGHRGDNFRRLVEREIDVVFGGGDDFAGGFDFVGCEVRFSAELGDDFAVDANLAAEDELFGVAAGGDAGTGD